MVVTTDGENIVILEHGRIRRGGEGDRGSGPPLKNHKNIGFLINSGPDPLKISKLRSQHSMLDNHRPPPAKHHLNGVSLAGR